MDNLGVALVVTGVVIAGCSLAALVVVALGALVPWSRLRPRYVRGMTPHERSAPALSALARSARAAGSRMRLPAGRPPVGRHPRGARHLLPLGR